jgi:tetratricopeptide (TPR) repeat protein
VLLVELGKGGMGAVYAAYDTELDRRVALKFLRTSAESGKTEEWRARLMREAKAMARLSHPNVVTLYDVGLSEDGRVFLAMEVVEGGTLDDWLKAEPRSWRHVVSLLCEAGEGLAAAHRAGIIHRDFKLDNVLFGRDGRPRVTDFGLARPAEAQASDLTPASSARGATGAPDPSPLTPSPPGSSYLARLTLTGTVMGTPGYMAPEQYTNEVEIDARADVFAFCAALHRALYGARAFEGRTVEEIAEATVRGKVTKAPRGTEVPPWVRKVLLWGLAPMREDRPASMDVLLAALRADPNRRRRRWLFAGAAVAATCAIAIGVHAGSERRLRECRALSDRLGGVWDGPRKAAIATAFRATGLPYAPDAWSRVEVRLDAYARAWTSSADSACEATRVRGEQSEAMLDLRTSCLEERLDELRALSDVFAAADRETVQQATRATAALPSLAPCSDLDRLSAATRLPPEPHARAEIRAIQAEIAEANELRLTGKQTQSRERLGRIRDRAEATRYGPVVVAWTMGVADVDLTGDVKAAPQEYERAIALADAYHLDHERASSELGLAHVGNVLAHPDDAHRWLRLVSATIKRLGGDPELELTRDVFEGVAYYNESKYEETVRALEPALERAQTEHLDGPLLADAESYLALALLYEPARFADAVAHARAAVAIDEGAFGPLHPQVANMVSNLGIVEEETGRLTDALATASRSLAIYQSASDRGEVSAKNLNLGNVLLNTGEILVRLDRPSEAVDLIERARAVYRGNDEHDGIVDADRSLAEAWRQLGRLEDAAQVCDEARSIADANPDMDPQLAVERLVVEARVALARGKSREALPIAERALTLSSGVSYLYDVSSARLVLARALVQGKRDTARARTLADQARQGFETLGDRARLEEARAVATAMR